MTDSSAWDRPRVDGPGGSAAPNDPMTRLRSEIAVFGSALGDVDRTARRPQLALVVIALVLGVSLPFATAGDGDDVPLTVHHLFGTAVKLFDSQLAFPGDDLHSWSNGPGRVLMLFGIAVLVAGVVIASAAGSAILSASLDRRASRLLTAGSAVLLVTAARDARDRL